MLIKIQKYRNMILNEWMKEKLEKHASDDESESDDDKIRK